MLASLGGKGKNRNSLACLRNAGSYSAESYCIARPAYTRTLCASHAHSTHTVGKRRQHVRDYVRAHFVPSASPTIAEVGRVQSPSQPNMKQRLEALKRSGSPTNGGSGTASPKSTGGSGTATPIKNGNVPGNVSKSRTDNKSKNE